MVIKSRALHGISEYQQKFLLSLKHNMPWKDAATKNDRCPKLETHLQSIKYYARDDTGGNHVL
uniref:Uncharacterized protein n=1 Tax=Arundo donax TaxID=35708 RepID=A0A0A9ETD9_ARUDO